MRGAILKGHLLGEYAEEVWRQALSVAGIARAIAPELGIEAEHAFMLGLLQDVGKVALLLASDLAGWVTGQTLIADGGEILAAGA